MRVTIPDPLADKYLDFAIARGVSPETVIARQLERFAAVDPYGDVLALGGGDLLKLSQRLHGGDVLSATDLIAKVERLASISFEGVNLQLTPAQLEELQHRAERQGRTVEDLTKEIWARMAADFFHTAGSFAG